MTDTDMTMPDQADEGADVDAQDRLDEFIWQRRARARARQRTIAVQTDSRGRPMLSFWMVQGDSETEA